MEENVRNGKALRNAKGEKPLQERKPAGRGQAAQRVLMIAGAIVGASLLIGAMVAPLGAQSYPNKPIRLIVRFPPGGGDDTTARIIGPKLAERLGQPVVIENRPGAGGNVGTEFAAKSRPDGYTIVLVSPSLSTSPSLYKKLNYDPVKDLAPIALAAQNHYAVLVRPSLPVNSLKEFVEYAKANPGKLNYGSSGIGAATHLACELLAILAKINIVHVAYKGAGDALIALMGGEVDMQILGPSVVLPQIQAGKVRALAVLSSERLPSLPNVPTAKEAGIDNYEVTIWYGILAPAGTPRDIINRLNAEWTKSAKTPETIDMMNKIGLEPLSSTPEEYSKFFKAEIVRWAKVIKDANLSLK